MILAVVIMFVIALLYGLLLGANASTPVPEGCQIATDGCHSCSLESCDVRKETK